MRIFPFVSAILAAALLPCAAAAQRTFNVPADLPSIQSAINSSSNGDTVLVAPGTYRENINFLGKNITVISSAGAPTTILDGGGTAPTVTFATGEARNAVLSGFTVQNGAQGGNTAFGGGIVISGSSPTIRKNIITGNACNGLASQGSSPLIQGNTISGTTAGTATCAYPGTALSLSNASVLGGVTEVDGNTIEQNNVARQGVVHAENISDMLLQRNEIRNNSYNLSGQSPNVINVISANFATLVGNYVHDNFTGGTDGGGLFAASALNPPNQTLYGLPRVTLLNNTFINNGSASGIGTQIFLYNTAVRALIANNIAIGPNSAITCYVTGMPQAPVILQNNVASAYSNGCALFANANNIFAPSAGLSPSGVPLSNSPALDTGNNSALPQTLIDLAGSPRAQSKQSPVSIDVGALEATASVSTPQTRIVVAPLRYEVVAGSTAYFSVALTSSDTTSVIPTTAVLFMDGAAIATAPIFVNTSTTFQGVAIPSGTHTIFATSLATANLPSAQSMMVRINGAAPGAVNAAIANPDSHVVMEVDPVAQAGTQLSTQFRCRLSDGTASGSMRQYDNGFLKGETLLTGAAESNATYFSDPGPHIYQCDYQDGTRSSSTVAAQVVVPSNSTAPPVPQLFSLPDPSEYGDPVTIGGSVTPYTASLNGTVRITEGTNVIVDKPVDSNGSATVIRTGLAPGVHTFFGTVTTSTGSTSGTFTQTVHFAPTRITLAATPTSGTIVTPIALTFATTSTYAGMPPTGTVDIFDSGRKLGIAGVVNGTVTLPANTFSGGTHVLSAVYNGSAIFAPATSNTVTITLTVPPPPDFSIAPANPTLTVQTEHHATTALTLTSINNFNGNVQLSCSNLPRVASCTFDKPAYALSSTAAVSFVLETSAIPGYKSQLVKPTGALALCLLLLLIPARLRTLRPTLLALAIGTVTAAAAIGLTGCSGKYPDHTPPGTYTVTITATGSSNGVTVTHTVPFTLTVTPE